MTHVVTLDLYQVAEPTVVSEATARAWQALLSPDERSRWQRLARPQDRQRFLLVRALVRTVLASLVDCAPQDLQFTADTHGKPRLQLPGKRQLQFNLSHTQGLCVLGVGHAVELGVDVEAVDRQVELLALARRYFATPEVQALEALDGPLQRERFFALWTLKEAWVNALGRGLRVPLDEFSFSGSSLPGAGQPGLPQSSDDGSGAAPGIALHCEPQLLQAPADWSFCLLRDGQFRIAVAAAHPARHALQLRRHDAWPLLPGG
jgi:phosphopantetheinyl transferase